MISAVKNKRGADINQIILLLLALIVFIVIIILALAIKDNSQTGFLQGLIGKTKELTSN